jgi:hypothetical protein
MPNQGAMKPYNAQNWYWVVAGSTTQVYSSAAVAYVPVADPTYVAWLATGGRPTKIAVEQDLWDVLTAAGVAVPATATASDGQKDSMFDSVPQVIRVWAFAIDNRTRVLEGLPTRTAAQFKSYVKSLLP